MWLSAWSLPAAPLAAVHSMHEQRVTALRARLAPEGLGRPAHSEGVASMIEPSSGLLRACDLPEWIARDDGRGRVVAVRQFIKDWAASDALRRKQMIADAPRRWRW